MSWQTVKIGDFLKRSKITVDIEDSEEYKRVTIRGKHQGVSLRDIERGKSIGTKKQFFLKKGQFILSKIDARYGAFGIAPPEVDDAIITGNFWAYDVDKEKVNIEWFNQYTNSPIFYDLCERASSGITHRKYLDESFFLNYEIDLPSIDEQETVIGLINNQKDSINKVSTELNHQLALVKELRQAYLREAMQGKLVPQDSADEPAEILLEKIKVEKENLVAEKRIRRDKPLPPINAEEIPFEIPSNWTWCRLGEIVLFSEAGSSFKCVDRDVIQDEWGVIKTSSITSGFFIEKENKFYSATKPKDISKQVNSGDFLFCRASGSKGLAGKSCIVGQISRDLLLSDKTIRLHFSQFIKIKLIWFYNNSMFGEDYYNSLNTGKSTTMNNVTRPQIYSMPFPLPPSAEQERIVAKLKKLMKFCDELETNIRQGIKNADQLLQTALKEALEPKIVQTFENQTV